MSLSTQSSRRSLGTGPSILYASDATLTHPTPHPSISSEAVEPPTVADPRIVAHNIFSFEEILDLDCSSPLPHAIYDSNASLDEVASASTRWNTDASPPPVDFTPILSFSDPTSVSFSVPLSQTSSTNGTSIDTGTTSPALPPFPTLVGHHGTHIDTGIDTVQLDFDFSLDFPNADFDAFLATEDFTSFDFSADIANFESFAFENLHADVPSSGPAILQTFQDPTNPTVQQVSHPSPTRDSRCTHSGFYCTACNILFESREDIKK